MKEVLITGAGSGIGEAIAKLFSQKQYKVYLVGRTLEKLEKVQSSLAGASECLVCDQGQKEDLEKLHKDLKDCGANISVLVNNAAIYRPGLFSEQEDANWIEQININLLGPVRLTQLLWPQLVQNKGVVTNISSNLGLKPIENTSAYSATKAAMNSWTQTLALEAGPMGIRVNAICPGLVDTPIHSFHGSSRPEDEQLMKQLKKLQPLGRVGQPEDIASMTYFVSSEEASWMTGALVPVDGGGVLTARDIN